MACLPPSGVEKGRGNRRHLQIDTTQNRRKAIIDQRIQRGSFALLRTVVVESCFNFVRCIPCVRLSVQQRVSYGKKNQPYEIKGCKSRKLVP
jgi:hypothetical protein